MKLIVATNCLDGIGANGQIPWPYCKADMKLFRRLTKNQTCMVGRKTYEDVGELPNRKMVVVGKGYNTFEEALAQDPTCCIGGEQLYMTCLMKGIISEVHQSMIQDWTPCDAFFKLPQELLDGWDEYKKSKGKKGINPPDLWYKHHLQCENDLIITDLNLTF